MLNTTMSSDDYVRVTGGAGADLVALYGRGPCRAITVLTAGTLVVTNPAGTSRNLGSVPAGTYVMQATAIGSGTTVDVIVWF